jgi:hypothetical protein
MISSGSSFNMSVGNISIVANSTIFPILFARSVTKPWCDSRCGRPFMYFRIGTVGTGSSQDVRAPIRVFQYCKGLWVLKTKSPVTNRCFVSIAVLCRLDSGTRGSSGETIGCSKRKFLSRDSNSGEEASLNSTAAISSRGICL